MTTIIALCGPKGCGKSTLATQLQRFGFVRKRFAGTIKLMLGVFLSEQGASPLEIDRMLEGDLKEIPTEYLCGNSPRYAMQTLGTEWRDLLDTNLWIEGFKRSVISHEKVIVDDLRFLHEEKAVRDLGGKVIRIVRSGCETDFNHPSESEYLNIVPDLTIFNSGTPEDMVRQMTEVSL